MPDRVGIVGAVQRHVANPQRAKTERIGQRREFELLVEIRDGVTAAQQRQRQADRQSLGREDAMRDVGAVEGGQGHVHSLKTGRSARAPYGVRMLTCSRRPRRDPQRRVARRETEALRHAPRRPVRRRHATAARRTRLVSGDCKQIVGVMQAQAYGRRTRPVPATPASRRPSALARAVSRRFTFETFTHFHCRAICIRVISSARTALRSEAWCAPCISACAVSAIAGAARAGRSLQWVGRTEDGDNRMKTDRIATRRVANMNRRPARDFTSPLIAAT